MNSIKCIRCGICCLEATCSKGRAKKDGICKYIYFKKNIAYCKLLVKSKVTKIDIGINGNGCMLRHFPEHYNFHKQINKQIIKELTI